MALGERSLALVRCPRFPVPHVVAGQAVATRITGDPETGNNGLFYFLVDHLGSTTLMVTTAGVIMSTAYFLPFGSYRSTPPPGELTDTGFTGHKQQDNVGLIYMNARYYIPAINRFLTADTLVPSPTTPQAFNRYTYVLGNPLRLVDPSGHGHCDADGNCISQPYTPPPPPRPSIAEAPMILFAGEDWTDPEKATIQQSAYDTGSALARTINAAHPSWNLSPEEAFLLVYGGSVTFTKTGQSCLVATGYSGCWGRSTGKNSVEVFTDIVDAGGVNRLVGDVHWAVHELGHSFVSAVGKFSLRTGGPSYTLPSLLEAIQGLGIGFPDRPSGSEKTETWGFAGGRWEWQRSSSGLASEEFADMYLGWVYNQWETNAGVMTESGSMRSDFMNGAMPFAIDLAIGH